MNLIARLLGRSKAHAPRRDLSPPSAPASDATRRELVAMAVNDTLRKHGIPPSWITAEASPATTLRKQRGLHLRLVVRQWQPRLLDHGVALQKSVRARIARLDPLSREWLTGVSWKLEPVDEAACPALPDPGYWRALRMPAAPREETAKVAAAAPSAQAALQRMLGARDQAFAAARRAEHDEFRPTQPMLPHDQLLSAS
jgi:hypothetical protein